MLSFFLSTKFVGDPRTIRDFLFFALSMMSVFLGVKKSKLSFWCMILIIVSFLYNQSYNHLGWIYQFPMLCAGIICFHQLYHSPLDFRVIRLIIGVLAFIATVWGILNYFGIEPYHYFNGKVLYNPQVVMSGPLFNHTLSSVYPALALAMGFHWVFLVFFVIGLVVYGSTMSLLAGLIGFTHYQLEKRDWFKWWFYPLGGLVLILLHGHGEFFSGQERMAVWKNVLSWSPLSGGGLGYFHDFYMKSFSHGQYFIQEHNEYLAAYTTYGIAGVAVLLFGVYLALKANPSRAKSATIAFLFLCVGSFPLHISSLAIIGIMLYTLTIQGVSYGVFKNEIN